YTTTYVDYFESEIEKHGGDWNKVVHDHLYSAKELLGNGFCGGRALHFLF
ncbi:hypothetical protein IWW34DRAFT_640651, partial [Fusarium oxysporum f. sp. albedinis]